MNQVRCDNCGVAITTNGLFNQELALKQTDTYRIELNPNSHLLTEKRDFCSLDCVKKFIESGRI
jgi:hypothetical protein